jgi:hypothetical protein
MPRQALLLAVAGFLCIPLVHVGIDKFGPESSVDYESPEWKAREQLIKRAVVFVTPPPDIPSLDLSRPPNDPHPLDPDTIVECRYVPKATTATTPKFNCRLPNGDVIKVKYGRTPERLGEVAATRLLAALGFGADPTTMLPRVRCIGCPWFPFQMRRLAELFYATPILDWMTGDDRVRDFTWVSAERKMPGRAIEVGPHEGWDWRELSTVDAAQGGATRAELDALRLIAIFLSHWDNKATNQRLACEEGPGENDPRAPCKRPLLMLQDVGATFGPTKVEYDEWVATPIWADAATCMVSLQNMPYHGGNFAPTHISEEGRLLLASKLRQLSATQITRMLEAAHFTDPGNKPDAADVSLWVTAFQDKVRQIVDRPPCPAVTAR